MNKGKLLFILFYTLLLACIVVLLIVNISMGYCNHQELKIVVKDKYVKGQSGTYMVVDEEGNTYQITDLLFKGKFNSSDLYSQLEIGKKYDIETTGYRIPFLSWYKNINKISEEEK